MCRRVTCQTCDKPTWSGCGAHVEQVLGDIPDGERCACQPASGGGSGVLNRFFGR